MIVCPGVLVLAPHHPQPQPVGPGQEEAEGDLRPVHGGDPPLVDLEDAVTAAKAAYPGRTSLTHSRQQGRSEWEAPTCKLDPEPP